MTTTTMPTSTAPTTTAPTDYAASGSDRLPGTPVARWDANIAAIRTLKELESEGRPATPAEQAVLAKYSGFGDSAFEQGFGHYSREPAWEERKATLRELVSGEEYEAIKQSRLNAFYTSPEVIKTMWQGLEHLGADKIPNPKVLEPSSGSGRFLALQPPGMAARSERTAVELDNLTAGMVKRLYPNASVWNMGFQDAPLPDDSFDVAISNVPFGNYGVHDSDFLRSGRKFLAASIHNYFFAKTLDKLRPGGVLAFVTTHHTLDSEKAQRVREYLAEQADLLGAVRLPENAFPDTQVVTDIIYLRKRLPGEEPGDASWVETVEAGVTDGYGRAHAFPVNKYFAENPHMVLGKHSAGGTMYRLGSYTVERGPGSGPLPAALTEATRQITAVKAPDVLLANRPVAPARQPSSSLPAPKDSPKLGAKDAAKVQEMAGLRDSARRLLDMERGGGEGGEGIGAARAELREQYQRFVEQHQALNDKANYKLMAKDPDAPVLFALENFDKETKSWKPAAIFSRRVIGAPAERDVANVSDAMSVAFNESGSLDFDRMGQLLGQSPDGVRAGLAGEQLIFHNPEGSWEPANEYLTGRVRDKLWTARQVAAKNPAYQGNVEALEAVQPEDVPAGDIAAPLGAPWIPDSVVNQWVREHWDTPRGNWFKYSEDIGQWSKAGEVPALDATLRSDWGTPQMGADDILLHTLKGSPVNITKPDGQGGRVKDLEGTLAAQGKASRMQESFSDWIWQDPERNARLARKYNDTHNALRPRVFDGSHQEFPGMAPEWQKQLRGHQRDATFRVVHDGTALLAHEVGFGKTAVMVASAMERKRLGLVNKPVFVVPKATHKQFTAQFREIYPGAKLLSPDEKDFSSENREVFLSRIATGDWDGVILTSEQFQKIPVSPETEVKWIRGQLDDLRSAQEELARDSVRRKESRTQKQIQKSIESLNVKLKDLRAEMREATDKRALSFETLGIDQIYVDEADRYKNLPFATSMGQIKGLPNSESKRAWDMFLKAQYVQEKGERKPGSFARNGVVFATGTPVANTIAEAWTMMRYLQLPELRRRGLHHFDPWAKTYGSITSGLEQTPQGQYKVTQRFAKFVNLPELSQLFQNVADVRVASEVPEMLAAQPRLVDEEGNPKRTTVVAPSHPALGEYMEHLRARVDKLGNVDPTVDNMLLISSDARKAALDLRMVDPSAPANPNGKVQLAAEKIAAVYRGEQANRGTQLVFLDIGTPKARDKAGDLDPEGGGSDLTANEQRYVSDVYAVLKRELERRGVPDSQIAFIQDHKTDRARKDLFEKVNSGDVRVLAGSTETAGVGVNVQKRAAALHHLDVPWRPRDIEQREGRIVRQGNEVYGPVYDDDGQITAPGRGVKIYQYVQEGSFDEFMWQAVQVKGQAVKALMKRNMSARSMEDIDPLVLGAAEAKALASGNPLIMRAEGLKNQVNTLRLERAAQRNQAGNAASRITLLTSVIDGYRDRIPKMEEDARLAANLADAFSATVNGKVLDSRPKAGEAVQAGLKSLAVGAPPRGIGAYKSFQVSAVNTDRGYQLIVSNPATGVPYRSGFIGMDETSPAGLVSRLENLVKGIPNTLESTKQKLQESEASLAIYRSQVGKPFERAGELSQLEAELRATQAALSGDSEGHEDTAPAPSSDRQADASGIRADGQPVVAATTGEQARETRRERQAQEAAVEQWGQPGPEALQSRPPDPVQHGPALSEWSAQEPEATEATVPGPAQPDTLIEDTQAVDGLRQPVARREEQDLAPLTEAAPESTLVHDGPLQHGPALSEWSAEPETTEAAAPGPAQPDTLMEDAQSVDELQTGTPAYLTETAPEPTQVHDAPAQHGPALSEWPAEPEATEATVPGPAQPDTLMEDTQALDELRQPGSLQADEGPASLTETAPEPTQIHGDPAQHGPALSEWSAQEPEATEATVPGPPQPDTPLEDAQSVDELQTGTPASLAETVPESTQVHDDPVQPHGPALSEWSAQEPEATETPVPAPAQPDTLMADAQALDELRQPGSLQEDEGTASLTETAPEPTQIHGNPAQHGPALSEWSAQEPEATEIPVPAPAQPDTLMEGTQALDELRQPGSLQEDEGPASLTETVPEPTQIHERWERDQEVAPAATPAQDTGAGLEPPAQSTLGNDLATNRSLEMPVASPPAKAALLADVEALEALKYRREQLAVGQQDIFEEDTELAKPNVPPEGAYRDVQDLPDTVQPAEAATQWDWQEGSPESTIDTPPERLAPDWDLSEDECLTLGESSLCMVSPEELRFDAATFQYKANTDSSGISDKLQDVKAWDPDLAGISYVWERKDGTRFIVDGHQRLGLAQRLAAEGQDPQLLVKIWREEDGVTAEDMRLRAAKKNIAEQSGTAVDAARVLKQKPSLLDSVSRQNAVARDARRLAQLDDEVFEEAAGSINAGKLDATNAGLISQNTHNAALQRSLLRTLTQASASEDMTVGKAQELVYAYKEAQSRHQEGKAQGAMFDDAAVMESAWKERAALLSGLVKSFKDDKRLFGTVTRKEGKLEDAGNVLDEISNQHHLDDAQKGIFIFETLAHTRGPLADYLTRQAERIKQASDASGKPAGPVSGPIVGESAKFLRPFLRDYHHGGADRLQKTLKGPDTATAVDPEPVADTGESNGLPEAPVPTSVPDEAPPPVTRRVRARPSGTTAGTTAVPAAAPVGSPARRVRTREKVPAPVASPSPGGSRRAAPKASPARQLSLDEQILQEAAIKLGGKKHSHHQGIKQPKMVKGSAAMPGSRGKKRSGRMPFTGGMGRTK